MLSVLLRLLLRRLPRLLLRCFPSLAAAGAAVALGRWLGFSCCRA